jgi:hypothetical protein
MFRAKMPAVRAARPAQGKVRPGIAHPAHWLAFSTSGA